jgi:dTMP kinase
MDEDDRTGTPPAEPTGKEKPGEPAAEQPARTIDETGAGDGGDAGGKDPERQAQAAHAPFATPSASGSEGGGSPEEKAAVTFEIRDFKKILKNRNFMALWIGQGISGIGDWVIVGVLLDKINQTNPQWGIFWMMTFRFLPAFLFGLVAGALVDRLERKATMVFCDICRALLVFSLAFSNSLPLICGLVFGIECFSLVFGPAKDASIPDLVPKKDELITANSLMSTSTYLTMAIGTLIATVFLAFAFLVYKALPIFHFVSSSQFQYQFAFIIDSLTFVASAMLVLTIAFPKRFDGDRPKISASHVWRDTREGLTYMRTNPLTRSILGVMIIGFIGGGSLYVLGAPFAAEVLHSTGAKFTLILTFLLSGVVVGAALAPWLNKYLPKEKWFGRAVVGFGLVMVVFAFVDVYVVSLVVICIGGAFLGFLLVTAYTLLHQNLEDEIRGRVFAAMQTIMRTCLLISMGIFAAINALLIHFFWGPLKPGQQPVGKVLNLGFISKSFYPAMIALIIGGLVVIVGGIVSMRGLRTYFKSISKVAA